MFRYDGCTDFEVEFYYILRTSQDFLTVDAELVYVYIRFSQSYCFAMVAFSSRHVRKQFSRLCLVLWSNKDGPAI